MIGKLEIHMRKMFSVSEKINLEMENLSLRLKILDMRMDNIELQTKEKAKLEMEITAMERVKISFVFNKLNSVNDRDKFWGSVLIFCTMGRGTCFLRLPPRKP